MFKLPTSSHQPNNNIMVTFVDLFNFVVMPKFSYISNLNMSCVFFSRLLPVVLLVVVLVVLVLVVVLAVLVLLVLQRQALRTTPIGPERCLTMLLNFNCKTIMCSKFIMSPAF